MRITPIHICLLLAGMSIAPLTLAQDAPKPAETAKAPEPEPHFYRLNFVVQEIGADGKPTNSRSYMTTVNTKSKEWVAVRAESRVPVAANMQKSGTEVAATQFQYMNLGVSFDVRGVQEVGRQLALNVKADVNSLVPSTDPQLPQPVVRHNQWDAPVLVAMGKATPIFTSDALDNKTAMQVVLTATPVP